MRTSRKLARALGAALVVLAAAAPALAWGRTGHSMINRLAIGALPEGALRDFLKENKDYIAEHSIDPDEYKKTHKAEEGPKHYLDICVDGPAATYPRNWKSCVSRFGEATATKQGTLPWALQAKFEELVKAFKEKNATAIIERATWLGHYVGDAHVPFHACANNNGQLTGQKGIHSIWESNMVDHHQDEIEAAALKLMAKMDVNEVKGEVSDWVFDRVVAGDKLSHEILEKDKGFRTGGREKALWESTGETCQRRIAEAANGLACLWHTAWLRAGKPQLPSGAAVMPKKEDKPAEGGGDEEHGKPDSPPMTPEPPKADPPKADPPKADPPPSVRGAACGLPGLTAHDDDGQPGAVIDSLEPNSAGAQGGLLVGDVLIAVDGNHVNSVSTLTKRFQDYKKGDAIPVSVLRKGVEKLLTVRMP